MLERLHYIMYIANIADADQPARIHDLSTLRHFFKTRAARRHVIYDCLISRIFVPRLRGFRHIPGCEATENG